MCISLLPGFLKVSRGTSDWKIMNQSPDITLLNPLDIFNGNYTILQQT
jgi:hypothetical protein